VAMRGPLGQPTSSPDRRLTRDFKPARQCVAIPLSGFEVLVPIQQLNDSCDERRRSVSLIEVALDVLGQRGWVISTN